MYPASFEYHAPATLQEAIARLGKYGDDAKVLSGSQSLIPLMKLRLAAPAVIVDLGRVEGLSYIREDAGVIAIGALTRHADVAASDAVPRVLEERLRCVVRHLRLPENFIRCVRACRGGQGHLTDLRTPAARAL